MAIGNLGTPRFITHKELRDYANHPDGNENVGDRPNFDIYTSFTVQHDYATGAHAAAGCMVPEDYTYTGNGADNRNISLQNANIDIAWILIWRADTEYPVFKSSDMAGDTTKELETNAFQANMIQDITTTGQFQVGSDVAVNENLIEYHYFCVGTV